MRVLQVHNFYRQAGGEDQVFAAEHDLLAARGHRVTQYTAHNESLTDVSAVSMAARTVWNPVSYREVRRLIRGESIELLHAHNTFPILSPAVYYAARAEGVPVVQTLHNYRLLCPAATFFRAGAVCEQCLGRAIPYPAIVNRCYRRSTGASLTAAAMLAGHRAARTWRTKVDAYIALTAFAKNKFVEGGLPAGRICIKPGFTEDPGYGSGTGGYALFLGRLTEEKGVGVLCRAWDRLGGVLPLKVAGDGPLRSVLQATPGVEYLGQCSRARILELLRDAAFLVVPSLWYEGFAMVVVEALACGTPVVASALGSLNELIADGVNGFRFTAGEAAALVSCIERGIEHGTFARMRAGARTCYERNYTATRNYDILMQIYSAAARQNQPL
jgi:glycosyltransferase involved in cell wall biosynthesis